MDATVRRIKISIGGISLEGELKPTRTATEIFDRLPIEAPVNMWGEEFYCNVPGVKDYRETATTQVKVGDIAFWGVGQMLAIFFGRTPMSLGDDPVPADRVNIVGRIIGDPKQLCQVMGATTIRVEAINTEPV
ncbi:MAG: cyclophilin-like fold protein [Nitrospirae bacterium]|jgi:hypothetical protein|nr:cyclophilin-like fold protein [Nitrospirota bacterium]